MIEELEPKVLSRKDDLGKYCFKNEHKLKSKNSGKVLNSYKEITICGEKKNTKKSFEEILSFQKKVTMLLYQPWAETQQHRFQLSTQSRYMLISYGTLIRENPRTRVGREKRCICYPRTP